MFTQLGDEEPLLLAALRLFGETAMQAVLNSKPQSSVVHAWFDSNLAELTHRCNFEFRRLPFVDREEAVAETIAAIFQHAARAAVRGKLRRLTPYTLVLFFGRLCRAGRRMAGFTSTDVFSETPARRRHHAIIPLHEMARIQTDCGEKVVKLSDVLADPREDSPMENARRNIDYPEILRREHVGVQGRRVFEFLATTHGDGRQKDLASELGISAGRVTQIKGQLAACLARHEYGPPVTRRRNP